MSEHTLTEKEIDEIKNDERYAKKMILAIDGSKLGVIQEHTPSGLDIFVYHPEEEQLTIPYDNIYDSGIQAMNVEAKYL